jgi:hypothetical protein
MQLNIEKKKQKKYENEMKSLLSILFFAGFLLFAGQKVTAQALQQRDTTRNRVSQTDQTDAAREDGNQLMQRNQNQYRQQEGSGKAEGSKTVKQVRSARPDMSKAQGARPSSVVRPSGSGIPKGMGKPGGVGRKSGR